MIRKHILYLILCSAVLLATSCGQQYKAKRIAEDFMKSNLKDATRLKVTKLTSLDSTKVLSDSVISDLRQRAENTSHYKRGITYSPGGMTKKLLLSRVSYELNGKRHQDTYYFDDSMTRVVAFKINEE